MSGILLLYNLLNQYLDDYAQMWKKHNSLESLETIIDTIRRNECYMLDEIIRIIEYLAPMELGEHMCDYFYRKLGQTVNMFYDDESLISTIIAGVGIIF